MGSKSLSPEAYCAFFSVVVGSFGDQSVRVAFDRPLTDVGKGAMGRCLESNPAGGRCPYACTDITVLFSVSELRVDGDLRTIHITPADSDGSPTGPIVPSTPTPYG